MIDTIVDLAKIFLRPSSVTFLVGVLGVGVLLSFLRRTRHAARWYFAAVFAAYWIFTTPACAERLIVWSSGNFTPIVTAAEARGARTIVVLGGGNQTLKARGLMLNQVSWSGALRVMEGVRLYSLLGAPTIIVSGGTTGRDQGDAAEADAMRTAAIELGVPAEHIIVEKESRNTREEALIIRRMLADRLHEPVVLVTSPTHMTRSLGVFRAANIDAIPSVAVYKSDYSMTRLRWLPNDGGLMLLTTVIYDVAATAYYRLRGWTATPLTAIAQAIGII